MKPSEKFKKGCNKKRCTVNGYLCYLCLIKWMDKNTKYINNKIAKYCKLCVYVAKGKTYCTRWAIKQTGNKKYCKYRLLKGD